MQGEPPAAALDVLGERPLLLGGGTHVARIGDEQVRGAQRLEAGVVLEDAGAHPLVLAEFAQQFQPRDVEVVPLTAADQDFYRISAKAHERLVFEVEARRLTSAIDPTLEVLDSSGRRLVFVDDTPGLGVDARVDVTFPKAGSYFVLVHDSKYSEQETTFYRLKVGSYPYAEGIFPLGWQRGKSVDVTFFCHLNHNLANLGA